MALNHPDHGAACSFPVGPTSRSVSEAFPSCQTFFFEIFQSGCYLDQHWKNRLPREYLAVPPPPVHPIPRRDPKRQRSIDKNNATISCCFLLFASHAHSRVPICPDLIALIYRPPHPYCIPLPAFAHYHTHHSLINFHPFLAFFFNLFRSKIQVHHVCYGRNRVARPGKGH